MVVLLGQWIYVLRRESAISMGAKINAGRHVHSIQKPVKIGLAVYPALFFYSLPGSVFHQHGITRPSLKPLYCNPQLPGQRAKGAAARRNLLDEPTSADPLE
eukprot:scaffold41289_cov24-Cyclotella_meneghiniana.AAC.1